MNKTVASAFLFLTCGVLEAGTLMNYKGKKGDLLMYVEPNKVVMEVPDKNGGQSIVFDDSKKELVVIDHSAKEYSLVDPEKIKNMMDEALKGVPPEQQKMMREMMQKGLGGTAAGAVAGKVEMKFIKNEKIGKYDTKLYHVIQGTSKESVWVATASAVGAKVADMKGLEKFAERMKKMAESFKDFGAMFPDEFFKTAKEGIAVKHGEGEDEYILQDVKSVTYTADKFTWPSNYKEKKMSIE